MKDETYEALEQVKELILEALEEETSKPKQNVPKILRMKSQISKELLKLPLEFRKQRKLSNEEMEEIKEWINEFTKKYL